MIKTFWPNYVNKWLSGRGMAKTLELARKISVTTTQDFEVAFDGGGEGPFVRDMNGKGYFDMSCGAGSRNFGYNIPEIKEAIVREYERCENPPDQDWVNTITIVLKKYIQEITPGKFTKKVFLGNSGAEAVEAAIKLLLAKRPERKKFIAFRGAFHGRTGYALALNGSKPVHREHFPMTLEVIRLPFPEEPLRFWPWREESACLLSCARPEDVNAVFVELIQGEGGINVLSGAALADIKKTCLNYDIKLVVDEVQTGFWRTGKLFACEHYGIEPDVICLGKAMTGGVMPVSAMVCKAELDFDRPGRHSNTYGGYPLGAVAALTAIELMEKLDRKKLEENVRILSEFAPEGLGLMRRWRFATVEDRNRFIEEAKKRGILLLGSGEKNVRFMPPVNVDPNLLRETLDTLRSIPVPHL